MFNKIFAWISLLLWLIACSAYALEIQNFSPDGTVAEVVQVRVGFSEDVVAFGDLKGSGDPFEIQCAVKGQGRWVDSKNWVYDFEKPIPGGFACSFKVKSDFHSFKGSIIEGRKEFQFDTGGPSIARSEPWEGNEIDEEQIFILHLKGEVDPKKISEYVYFSVEGIKEKIPVKVLPEDPRKSVSYKKRRYSSENEREEHIVVIQAKRRFPPNVSLQLVWGAGLSSQSGMPTRQDQVLSFRSRPEFKAELSCERENADADCMPLSSLSIRFTAQVPWKTAKKIRLKGPAGREWSYTGNENLQDDEGVSYVEFKPPFPEKTQFEVVLPKDMVDDAGRPLSNASRFPLKVAMTDFPPLAKFQSDFGILESKPEAILPLTVRNVEEQLKIRLGGIAQKAGLLDRFKAKFLHLKNQRFEEIVQWRAKIAQKTREVSLFHPAPENVDLQETFVSKPNGERSFEVIGIPLKQPGFYVVELESKRLGAALLGKDAPFYVHTSVLVTNLSVHFKKGRESSLVWVTTLDEGKPVGGAQVAVRSCTGSILANGETDEKGIWQYTKEIPIENSCGGLESGYYVTAEKEGDFSFVHSDWQKGIESWRFQLPGGYILSPEFATTVFDRTLFRAGETVHMKHFFRKHTGRGLQSLSAGFLPKMVRIAHRESNQTYEVPVTWRNNGVAETTWHIPQAGKLGEYSVSLVKAAVDPTQDWNSGSFRVEEYRVPLMRGVIQGPVEKLVAAKTVPVAVSVQYLAGGGASQLPVQMRYQCNQMSSVHFSDFEDFSFGLGKYPVHAYGDDSDDEEGEGAKEPAQKLNLKLDRMGMGQVNLSVCGKKLDLIKNLQMELEYRDPNGEIQSTSSTIPIYPSTQLVGVKTENGFATKKSLRFQVAVTDLKGKGVAQAPVEVTFLEHKTYSHRKRLVGGFYSYENRSEIKSIGKACAGQTNEKGLLSCEVQAPVSGNIILEAKSVDAGGLSAVSYSSTWIYDSEEWWFAQNDSDRIDLLPERKRYEAGETASFQVRMPFREATALVTVEREGIIDSFVTPLSGSKPIIQVPIKSNYSPNVFVSALVVRGRVGEVQPTAQVDLGRPAFKLGIGEVQVGWKPHELNVVVQSSKDVYQVREKGQFRIQAKRADGGALPKGSEVALAVVDAGLLQLKSNESWKLLETMMQTRGYEVKTSSAQGEVVGKRHFGMKSLPAGGDGGAKAPARSIFDSLLYWNAKIPLNAQGEAEIQFPMNDSITGFKIAAVVHGGADLFGTGYASIRTTQDLMIISGIPPVVREGDTLDLGFTLRNTTNEPMALTLSGRASGLAHFSPPELILAPNESKVLKWPVQIPRMVSEIKYSFFAKDRQSRASDEIQVTQKVIPAVPIRIFQSTLVQVEPNLTWPIEKPKDALPSLGGIRARLSTSLAEGLGGVREYINDYPYTCLEQKSSRAVVLRDTGLWKKMGAELPNYLDRNGLAKYFPSSIVQGSDILTTYLLVLAYEAGWELPKESQERMLQGLKDFVEGRLTSVQELPTVDLNIRKIEALGALARYQQAKWEMTGSLQMNPPLWPSSAVLSWRDFLTRIETSSTVEEKRKQADQILRSRLSFQGTNLSFSTDQTDTLPWMMVSNDVNANHLLLSVLEDPSWKDDVGRLIQGALSRQSRGHWDTTTANAWGSLAVEKFVKTFEKDTVTGSTQVSVEGQKEVSFDWKPGKTSQTVDFGWPPALGTLKVKHEGSGKPWMVLQSRAAIPVKAQWGTGYKVKKTWTQVEQKVSGRWSMGDIVRVKLEMEAQADMPWVVVNDPIPAGAFILGSGLGNDSQLAIADERNNTSWIEPAYQERAFDSYRAYYTFIPKGKWTVEYTIRLNQSGTMNLPVTRVEAMYAPEMFGELPNDAVSVLE